MTEPPTYDPIPWARYAGQQAREHGREMKSCPMYALGEEGRLLRQAWEAGWNKADAENRRLHPVATKAPKPKATPIRKGRRK